MIEQRTSPPNLKSLSYQPSAINLCRLVAREGTALRIRRKSGVTPGAAQRLMFLNLEEWLEPGRRRLLYQQWAAIRKNRNLTKWSSQIIIVEDQNAG